MKRQRVQRSHGNHDSSSSLARFECGDDRFRVKSGLQRPNSRYVSASRSTTNPYSINTTRARSRRTRECGNTVAAKERTSNFCLSFFAHRRRNCIKSCVFSLVTRPTLPRSFPDALPAEPEVVLAGEGGPRATARAYPVPPWSFSLKVWEENRCCARALSFFFLSKGGGSVITACLRGLKSANPYSSSVSSDRSRYSNGRQAVAMRPLERVRRGRSRNTVYRADGKPVDCWRKVRRFAKTSFHVITLPLKESTLLVRLRLQS